MSSILTAFDVSELHAMGDLELVMLWQSLICYQQKHLWLIGHIRTHHWAVVCIYIYISTHTHTGMLCFCLRYAYMLITHLHSLTNVYHILSCIQTLFKDVLKRFASAYT